LPKKRHDFDVATFRRRLGAAIRVYRIQGGLTQKQLGELSNLTSQYIGELERGNVNISVDSLLHICEALSTPLSYVVLAVEGDQLTEE
jgi:XRE family transcriptional regulator, regulator of sulfur utilization